MLEEVGCEFSNVTEAYKMLTLDATHNWGWLGMSRQGNTIIC